jgi:hypothetical protein
MAKRDRDNLDDGQINHARLKAASKSLGRPLKSLYAMSPSADPFLADMPSRAEWATWFAGLWSRLDLGLVVHVRRIHYTLVSQSTPFLQPNGEPYENTLDCWQALGSAGRDARYLGLLPADVVIIDRRNPDPVIYLADELESSAEITATLGGLASEAFELPAPKLYLPMLDLTPPTIPQPYHLEIWCEKSTVNDVLMLLGEQFGVNVITGVGHMSATACERLIDRAIASERPVRILYISDFDPSGESMPVAVARKIEFLIREGADELDIQVRSAVLTHEQCIAYRLPRTPLKDTERRAARFEARYGEGATELDALEALHPDALRQILEEEIRRYHDGTLARRIRQASNEVWDELIEIQHEVQGRHAEAIAGLQAEHQVLAAEIEQMRERIAAVQAAFEERARPVMDDIAADLEAEAPDADDYEWPEPEDGDEDPDPLFDSSRGYLKQLARYQQHQGKTETGFKMFAVTCVECGKAFTSRQPTALLCSAACRKQRRDAK